MHSLRQTYSAEAIATQIRRDIIRMVSAVNSGHPGGSLGCADLFTILYFEHLRLKPDFDMTGAGEDMFFLSNGHISPVWYATMARYGYFPVDELVTFRRIDSRLQGHPATHEGLPGVRVASGSLGQGVSIALGAALAKRLDDDPHHVYVLTGDGELQEGQIWEALMAAAHHRADHLTMIIDWNGQQIDGANDDVISLGDLPAKLSSFGWHVLHMDGHDMDDLRRGLKAAREAMGQGVPVAVLMKTEMGRGVDYMEGTHEWHGKAPDEALTKRALDQLEQTIGDY